MDGITVDGVTGSNNAVDEELLSAVVNDVARTMTSLKMGAVRAKSTDASDSMKFITGNSFLKDLFEVQNGKLGASVEELMEKYPYLPLFAIFSLLIADTMEGSVTTTMEIIQSQQKQQKAISQSIIDDTSYAQQKKEKLAFEENDSKALVGLDVTGANRKEDTKSQWWKLIIGVVVVAIIVTAVVVTCVASGGALAVPAIAVGLAAIGALMAIGSICSLIANVVKDPTHKKNLMLAASIINPVQAIAEGAVDAVCEIWGLDPNDEKVRKAKMWTTLSATILASVLLVAAGIASSVFTGGASGAAAVALSVANIMNIVSGIMTGATSIVTGALEIRNGIRALERAEMRKILNQVQASIDRMKMILDMIGTNIELWTGMFSNDMTIIRGEYERATRMLKEYNDQKVAIARNIRA